MYTSKYYTCEQIDQRLLQGYYDDAVAAGYTGSKAQYLAGLLKAINYVANPTLTADKVLYNPTISGLTSKNVQGAIDELANKKLDKASIVQESGEAEDKVMSQKVVSNKFNELITSLKAEFSYKGIAQPTTNPGVPDSNVFYLAGEGSYPNFNNQVIEVGQIAVLKWDGSWHKEVLEIGAGGGNMILDWNTDVATTRKQVLLKFRKPGVQISYKDPNNGWINEQYTGMAITDLEWVKDSNWNEISDKDDVDKKLASKPNVGSVFGGQKVEADGSNRLLEFTNFKSGITLHIVNLKIASNSYVSLYGYEKGTWKIIQQNVSVGTTINKDLVLPEEVEQYSKIGFGTNSALLTGGYGYILTELSIEEAIEKLENAASTASVRTKADVGSVFGAQKLEADGSSNYLALKNTFKIGDIIHFVSVKVSVNSWWNIVGYKDSSWKVIKERAIAGILLNYDYTVDTDISEYELIGITPGKTILSGYAYFLTELTLHDIEKIKEVTEYTDTLKSYPIIDKDVLLPTSNLINPTKVNSTNGYWCSDFIPVTPGTVYYGNTPPLGYYLYDKDKKTVTGTFELGLPSPEGVFFIKLRIGNSSQTPDKEYAISLLSTYWMSTENKQESYAKKFNPYLVDFKDYDIRKYIYPFEGKTTLYIGDSYVFRGDVLAISKYTLCNSTKIGMNGNTLEGFCKGIVQTDENIELLKTADIIAITGGINSYGHGGDNLGSFYLDNNTDNHVKIQIKLFYCNDTLSTTYNKYSKGGTFTKNGKFVLLYKNGKVTEVPTDNSTFSSTLIEYSVGETIENVIDKIAAMQFEGCEVAKIDANTVEVTRTIEGMYDNCNLKIVTSANKDNIIQTGERKDFEHSEEIDCPELVSDVLRTQTGDGLNINYGASCYEMLSTNILENRNIFRAIQTLINICMFFNPNAILVFYSQPERPGSYEKSVLPPYSKRDGLNMSSIADAMQRVCRYRGVPYCDSHSLCGITMENGFYYMPDGIHLGIKNRLVKVVGKFINSLDINTD